MALLLPKGCTLRQLRAQLRLENVLHNKNDSAGLFAKQGAPPACSTEEEDLRKLHFMPCPSHPPLGTAPCQGPAAPPASPRDGWGTAWASAPRSGCGCLCSCPAHYSHQPERMGCLRRHNGTDRAGVDQQTSRPPETSPTHKTQSTLALLTNKTELRTKIAARQLQGKFQWKELGTIRSTAYCSIACMAAGQLCCSHSRRAGRFSCLPLCSTRCCSRLQSGHRGEASLNVQNDRPGAPQVRVVRNDSTHSSSSRCPPTCVRAPVSIART